MTSFLTLVGKNTPANSFDFDQPLPPLGALSLIVLYITFMTTSYAMFNVLTVTGRVSHAEVVDGKYGKFLAVTLLSELQNDTPAVAIQFNNTNGLLSLFESGYLNNGRQVTVTGHLESFTELYFDKKAGKTKRLQRPRLQLSKAVVLDGGMGPGKAKDAPVSQDIEIDEAPALETAEY